MTGTCMEILVSISRFNLEVCDELVIFSNNIHIKRVYFFSRVVPPKFDGRMIAIKNAQEFFKFFLSMLPWHKDIINISPPNKWLEMIVFKKPSLQFIHVNNSIWWSHFSTYCCSSYLLKEFSILFEYVVFQNTFSELQ